MRLHASTSDKRSMSLDYIQKRKLPDWLLCRERINFNPVSLFTQSLVVAIRTLQHFEILPFVDQLDHKEPLTIVYEDTCWEIHCKGGYTHSHIHSSNEIWIYSPRCWDISNVQHVFCEKFDYVALSQEEIDDKEKAKRSSNWYRNSQFRHSDRARRSKCKRRLLF